MHCSGYRLLNIYNTTCTHDVYTWCVHTMCTHDAYTYVLHGVQHTRQLLWEYETAVQLYKCGCTIQHHVHTGHVYAGYVQPDNKAYNSVCVHLYAHRVIPTDILNSESKHHVYYEHKYDENQTRWCTQLYNSHINCTYKARNIHAVYTHRKAF